MKTKAEKLSNKKRNPAANAVASHKNMEPGKLKMVDQRAFSSEQQNLQFMIDQGQRAGRHREQSQQSLQMRGGIKINDNAELEKEAALPILASLICYRPPMPSSEKNISRKSGHFGIIPMKSMKR